MIMSSRFLVRTRKAPPCTKTGSRASFRQPCLFGPRSSIICFSTSSRWKVDTHSDASYSKPAGDLNQDVTKEEISHFDKRVAEDTSKQIRTPWMREGSDRPPVATRRSASAMTKGLDIAHPNINHMHAN
jgi:hypothetical protein